MSNYYYRYNLDSVAIPRACYITVNKHLPLVATAVYNETQYDSSEDESDPASSDLYSEDNDEH